MSSPSYLTNLAPEILKLIIEHTHASAHWPLAQTCRFIHRNSKPILERHREAHQTYRITSDIDPSTITGLLWSVFSHGVDSIEAWHVREFEVWADRDDQDPQGNNFKAWEVDAESGDFNIKEEIMPCVLSADEMDHFCHKMMKIPDFYDKSPDFAGWVRESLDEGRDTFTKPLLLAYLPRLRALRYAQRSDETNNLTLWKLCEFIDKCQSEGAWLPGLESLREVFFTIELYPTSEGVEDRPALCRKTDYFCALLNLPNMKEVYFSHMDGRRPSREVSERFPKDIGPSLANTSNVRTIVLDMLQYDLDDALVDFIALVPRGLENLAIRLHANNRVKQQNIDRLIAALAKHQGSSLRRLCIHEDETIDGRSYLSWRKPEELTKFKKLRVANVSWCDVERGLGRYKDTESRSELMDRLLKVFRDDLPTTMRIAAIGRVGGANVLIPQKEREEYDPADFAFLDDAVEAMIRSDRYKDLKAVDVDYIRMEVYRMTGILPLFPLSIKAAKERGIHACIGEYDVSYRMSMNGEFIPYPRRDCMVTGGFAREDRRRLCRTRDPHNFSIEGGEGFLRIEDPSSDDE
ncbi:unnamed protein product [Clonostachys rosea]|uniref:F-box domain-containing protein n=1 Tax=Bionectria ochroleuca TaxID=29856 RepID=A0ABY6UN92_BIOOC|nr:unnamed protein product [Clonostachys rosea]